MNDEKITPYNPDWFPPCFESKKQHREYMWQVFRTKQPEDELNYCMDCTREYKIKMLREKRCEHPETIFVTWKNTVKFPKDTVFFKPVIPTHSDQEEPDTIGISNLSRFWDTPAYDKP